MSNSTGNQSFFFKRYLGRLIELFGLYVDDILRVCTTAFPELHKKETQKYFQSKPP